MGSLGRCEYPIVLELNAGHTAADTGFTAAPDSKTLDCSSLRTGIDDLATVPGEASNTTFTVFPALLDVLGFTAGRITNLDVNTALVPSDRAFEDFFVEVGGDGVDPLSLVKRNPDVFKQVRGVFYQYWCCLSEATGNYSV